MIMNSKEYSSLAEFGSQGEENKSADESSKDPGIKPFNRKITNNSNITTTFAYA